MKITFLVSGNIRRSLSFRALMLAEALHKRGHIVSIIAPSADKKNNFVAEKIASIEGVRIIQPFQFQTKWPEINLLPYLFSASYLLLREKSDLVYIYKPTPISIIGLFAKLFYKTPVVLDIDDLGSEVMGIEGHPIHQRKIVEWSEKMAARYADEIVVASTYLFDIYRKSFPKKPIHIMPNGVDETWFEPIIASDMKRRIVFMGAINRQSILDPFFDILPRIIKRHGDVMVVIIGDGKYLNYFKEKAQQSKIESNIIFMGWLPIEKARAKLNAGDIGYNYMPDEPTTRAANNMKMPQYMARGVVPLVSDLGDLPLAVNFGNAGYICKANDPAALENGLLSALEDKERMKKSEHARKLAFDNFYWDHLAANFDTWAFTTEK